jgi:hypothetical protein
MKRLLVSSLLLSAIVCTAQAQNISGISPEADQTANAAADFSVSSAASVPLIKPIPQPEPFFVADTLDLASANPAASAVVSTALALPLEATPEPSPEPTPRFIYSDRDDYRWQLGLGVSFERFRSSIYSASAVGTDTSLTYFLNDWLGAEGDILTFFAPSIGHGEHIKLVNYGIGPRITWRRPRWEPWFHGIFGGSHALPQTAGNSQNGVSIQLGGGADYRLAPRLSLRLEVDYVRTRMFSQWQNNGQGALALVFHF